MEERKLTKADIDKVRHIEGFPIGKDEDIIALSRPPYYTACPNPFIEDFIRENGTPYDEATDDYHREPFAADVSEGKNDPIYNAHSYHTKVPYKAIMRYILHYTKPGDIVFDGFCGTGMTGVAAQMCGCPDEAFKVQVVQEMGTHIQWGTRKGIMNDLSPAACFIAHNYNSKVNASEFESEAMNLLNECQKVCGWVYETEHIDGDGKPVMGIDGRAIRGRINYVVWSDVLVCPSCAQKLIFWDAAVDHKSGNVLDDFACPHCHAKISKRDCDRVWESTYDSYVGKTISIAKQIPVHINYSVIGKRFTKKPDSLDLALIEKIKANPSEYFVPCIPNPDGEKMRDPARIGVTYSHQFYTERNLYILSWLWEHCKNFRYESALRFVLTGIVQISSKMSRFRYDSRNPQNTAGGILNGTLFIPSLSREGSVFENYKRRLQSILQLYQKTAEIKGDIIVTCSALQGIELPDNSVDYIFTDPPFGANINYAELSNIWEAWLGIQTNMDAEAIMSRIHGKGLAEYQGIMEECFRKYYHALKPQRWITVEFHNSKNAVWNAIQEALYRAGFIVADVRVISKKQGSYNQVTAQGAVQQDLVISAYKPK